MPMSSMRKPKRPSLGSSGLVVTCAIKWPEKSSHHRRERKLNGQRPDNSAQASRPDDAVQLVNKWLMPSRIAARALQSPPIHGIYCKPARSSHG